MNKFFGYFAAGSLILSAIMAFTTDIKKNEVPVISNDNYAIDIPEDVNAVLQDYCFGCHNSESKNEKGRDKLSIDKLGEMPKGKLAAKLNKLAKEIEEGEMPPKKFLEKYPEKEPAKKDKKTVVKWAKATAKGL
jgi:hypothetical protein